jgi:hypothetical protein
MEYDCWTSDSCYVCSGGTGQPRYHASSRGYQPTSPCDSTVMGILARNRREALRQYKGVLTSLAEYRANLSRQNI